MALDVLPVAPKKSTKKPTEQQGASKRRKHNAESDENDVLRKVVEVMETASRPVNNVEDADGLFG